jgi:hypothetical protein
VPGTTPPKEYVPVEVEVVVVLTLVASFVSVIFTPGTTAPVGSRIVPVIPPVSIWATRKVGWKSDKRKVSIASQDTPGVNRRWICMFVLRDRFFLPGNDATVMHKSGIAQPIIQPGKLI